MAAFESRWVDRTAPAMHEVAEALGTTTDLVMAVAVQGADADVMALWTPDYPADETVWEAWLARDADGILSVRSREPKPGLWESMKAALDRRLGDG